MHLTTRPIFATHLPIRIRIINWVLMAAMIVALFLIVAPFWPQATYTIGSAMSAHQSALQQAKKQASSDTSPASGNWLLIPDIQVKAQILEGPDIGVLDHKTGVWHQAGDIDHGNFVIAGHRFKYLPPNQTTFYNFDKLKAGELIVIWWNNKKYQYSITKTYTVDRDSTAILNPTLLTQLTLYTCTDLTASHRLVVIAKPKS